MPADWLVAASHLRLGQMRYGDAARALDELTDDRGFEKLATLLLSRTGINLRPIGGAGDRGRDAVAGLFKGDGEELAVAVSLEKDWPGKVRRDLARIASHGLTHRTVIFVTNRPAAPKQQTDLQGWAKDTHGVDLTVLDQRWLVARLYLRENLDLRREFLGLEPPRPHFFLDLGEYQELLARRKLLEAHFVGRENDMRSVENALEEARCVVVEAPGGYGKTRLVYELAASGESATPWFFVDVGIPFKLDHLAEAENGYEITIFVDDAHRRTDLEALLGALERREPAPRLIFAVRPGHASAIDGALAGLAFPSPANVSLGVLGRRDLATMLKNPPFEIERDAMLARIIALSEGNVGVAVLAAALAAAGADPGDLSRADIFRRHIESRLKGAGLDARDTRELLAIVAAVGVFDTDDPQDVQAAEALSGFGAAELRRRLDELADAGLVVEDPPGQFAVKPDVVREHIQRFSFFPDAGRALLRYERVYELFGHRLEALLSALGESGAETAPAAGSALRRVQRDFERLLDSAETPRQMLEVAALAVRLGAGASSVATVVADRLIARLDDLGDEEVEQLAPVLVELLSIAKFGRDRFPQAWRLLLVLARHVSARPRATHSRETVRKAITEIFASAPMNYSSRDIEVLGYMQDTVRSESQQWWHEEHSLPGAAEVGAILVAPAFTLQLEQHRQAAENAMAINLVAGFVPTWRPTEELLRLGVELFEATFLQLDTHEQLEQLNHIERLAHVASGYPGMLATVPSDELQQLCETVLVDIEQWLVAHLADVPLSVAAAAYGQLQRRRVRVGGKPARQKVALSRPSGDLLGYLDLVDPHRWDRLRVGWKKAHERTRARGARYGIKLAKARNPVDLLRKWNGWIEECEAAGQHVDPVPLMSAFGALARSHSARARELVEYILEHELAIGRFTDELLDSLAADEANWPLIRRWANDSSPRVRLVAARAIPRAPEALGGQLFRSLSADSDETVRDVVWRGLLYYSDQPLVGRRLNLALHLTEKSSSPLELLGQLFGRLRHQVELEQKAVALTTSQRAAVRRIILASARADALPHNHRLAMALEEATALGIDVVLAWLRERLSYLKSDASARYTHNLPDELQPLVYSRRRRAGARAELERLLDELEDSTTTGLYRMAIEEAVEWLGADSASVTRRIAKWARGSGRQPELAHHYVHSGSWRTFTTRARLLLDSRPDDPAVRDSLVVDRFPRSFIGSREPYLRARADEYRRWLKHPDKRLRVIAAQAIDRYEYLADQEAENERRVQEAI